MPGSFEMRNNETGFIEYELEIKNGEIVGCRYFGDGKQVDPLDGVEIYKPTGQPSGYQFDRWMERLERRLARAFKKLGS